MNTLYIHVQLVAGIYQNSSALGADGEREADEGVDEESCARGDFNRIGHALQVGGRGPPDNFVTKRKTRIFRFFLTHLEIGFFKFFLRQLLCIYPPEKTRGQSETPSWRSIQVLSSVL